MGCNGSFSPGIFCDNVSKMQESAIHWNTLHANPRFRPSYPNEDVVRFLLATRVQLGTRMPCRFLDIGAGGGRHMRLAADLNFIAYGVDISFTGLAHARNTLQQVKSAAAVASMTDLPFADARFHTAISFGSFYYGRASVMRKAIAEMHRVLVNGARAFIVLRSTNDFRYGKGHELEPRTFQLEISDTNELGTIQHFLREEDVPDYFSAFSRVTFEKNEITFCGRARVNSDWLITVEK